MCVVSDMLYSRDRPFNWTNSRWPCTIPRPGTRTSVPLHFPGKLFAGQVPGLYKSKKTIWQMNRRFYVMLQVGIPEVSRLVCIMVAWIEQLLNYCKIDNFHQNISLKELCPFYSGKVKNWDHGRTYTWYITSHWQGVSKCGDENGLRGWWVGVEVVVGVSRG